MQAFICFCGEPENTDILRAWIQQETVRDKIDIEKFPSVSRKELEQNVDAIMEQVNAREMGILIRNAGKADSLLFGWEDYLRRFSMLHTPEEIAEIEASCLKMKKAEET